MAYVASASTYLRTQLDASCLNTPGGGEVWVKIDRPGTASECMWEQKSTRHVQINGGEGEARVIGSIDRMRALRECRYSPTKAGIRC